MTRIRLPRSVTEIVPISLFKADKKANKFANRFMLLQGVGALEREIISVIG